MEERPELNGYLQSGVTTAYPPEANQSISPARSMVSNLYPVSQQSGYGVTTAVTLPNPMVLDQDLPPNHILLSILSTLFCLCPCGLVSLSYSVQVNSEFARGNTASAQYNSQQAWKWGIVSVAIGCIIIMVVMCYYLVLISLRVSLQ